MIRDRLKKYVPGSVRHMLRRLQKRIRYAWRRILITIPVHRGQPIRIILGAAETHQPGWYSTNEQWLDITSPIHWQSVFQGKKIITHAVAEHVFEHLTFTEGVQALRLLHDHMMPGGRIRIAVPDGYHPDPEYVRHVGINGIGDDAADHKQLLNVESLFDLLRQGGFTPHLVEGYDHNRNLVQSDYAVDAGYIWRSRKNRKPDTSQNWSFVDADTSLIVDGTWCA